MILMIIIPQISKWVQFRFIRKEHRQAKSITSCFRLPRRY